MKTIYVKIVAYSLEIKMKNNFEMKRRPNEEHSCKNGRLDDQGRLKTTHLVKLILGNWTLEKWDDEKV